MHAYKKIKCLITTQLFANFEVIIEKYLLNKYSTKKLYLATFVQYVASCVAIFYLENVFMIIPFCASFGFMMTTLTTLPYQMLSEFQIEEKLAIQNTDTVNNG